MRLDTAEKRAAYRASMLPTGAEKCGRSSELGEAYTYTCRLGRFYAIGFIGSAGKPAFHYRFKDEHARSEHIGKFFDGLRAHAEMVNGRRTAASAYRHDVKVGDIFKASWGYDQTNIDYYQVVELIGQHFAEVREICQQSEEDGYMQGECVPAPGVWATEPDGSEAGEAYKAQRGSYPRKEKPSRRVKIQSAGSSEPCFRVASYCHAYRIKPLVSVAGAKVYSSSRWTAYH